MKIIKYISIIIFILSLQSCAWFFGADIKTTVTGTVIDSISRQPIEGVKLEIVICTIEHSFSVYKTTDIATYSDYNGHYELIYKNIDGFQYLKPTHDEYAYLGTGIPPTISYPPVGKGGTYEYNITMIKRGKVKIEGDVMCDEEDFYWLPDVKISLLKRADGSANYPDTIGIYTYTDANGHFYIEFDGDENYEFFLKPEKEGYSYNWGGSDYIEIINLDPGYVYNKNFVMDKSRK